MLKLIKMKKAFITLPIAIILSLFALGVGVWATFVKEPVVQNDQVVWHESEIVLNEKLLLSIEDFPDEIEVAPDAVFGSSDRIKNVKISPDNTWLAIAVGGAAHDFGWFYNIENAKLSFAVFSYGGGVDVKQWVSNTEVEFEVTTPKPETSIKRIRVPMEEVSDTSDWKTYRNEEYGFEFKYPSQFGDPELLPLTDLDCSSRAYQEVGLVSFKNIGLGLACSGTVLNTPSYKGDKNSVKVANGDSYYFEYVSATGYINKEVYIPIDNARYLSFGYTFKAGRPSEYVELSSDTFNQALSTFKFTK